MKTSSLHALVQEQADAGDSHALGSAAEYVMSGGDRFSRHLFERDFDLVAVPLTSGTAHAATVGPCCHSWADLQDTIPFVTDPAGHMVAFNDDIDFRSGKSYARVSLEAPAAAAAASLPGPIKLSAAKPKRISVAMRDQSKR